MLEKLFRGKRIDNDEWVMGNLFVPDNPETPTQICIGTNIVRISYDIDPKTIGQYTGLTVPSGKIFEHDIVTAKFKSNGARFNFTVKYSNEKACFVFDNGSIKVPFNDIRSVRVIGNIHDNTELVGGADNGNL